MFERTQSFENVDTKYLNKPQRQFGVGMVEVLITIVILAIGLLGVASLQLIGSFSNKEALSRTQAVLVTQQFSERLRASTIASQATDGFVVHNNYSDPAIYNFGNLSCNSNKEPYACYCLDIPDGIPNCQTGNCNQGQIAIFDAYQVSCSTVRENSEATISVTCTDLDVSDADACTAGSKYKIIIKWPSTSWKGDSKIANTNCNENKDAKFDCVVTELTL